MLSMSIHSGIKTTLPCLSNFPSQSSIVGPFKSSSSLKRNPTPLPQKSLAISNQKSKSMKRNGRIYASETVEADVDESTDGDEYKVKSSKNDDRVFVVEKMKLVLKFIWMEKNIGIGLDQDIKGHGRVPLSPYFFWPRKDAWEELKTTLESKPWVSQKMMIILLNQATDIINLWQQSGGSLT